MEFEINKIEKKGKLVYKKLEKKKIKLLINQFIQNFPCLVFKKNCGKKKLLKYVLFPKSMSVISHIG